jgi:hypothetical protein
MNGFRAIFASAAALAAMGGAVAVHAAAPMSAATPSPVTTEAIAEARKPAAWPSLASVPPAPTDVRSLKAWKAAVLTTRAEGAELARQAAAEPWTLHDSEAWANEERDAAIPPPQITTASSEADTEAYAAALRARATPPPRKR